MTDARIGYGTKYGIRRSGGSLVQIAEVINVTPGEAVADRVDATHMLSPGRRREYIGGLIDNGEASLEINWIPGSATDELLRDLLGTGETADHIITFPNGVTVEFEAVLTGFSKSIPIDDRMTATITVAVSGEETWGSEAAPTNLVKPSIVGASVQVGVTLTAVAGEFEGAPSSFTYQWQHDASGNGTFANVLVGGTGETYVPVVGDIADFIRVGVTPSNTAGPGTTVYSLPVGPIIAA